MGACTHKGDDSADGIAKVDVEVCEVGIGSSIDQKSYSGVIEAGKTTSVSFTTAGTVESVNFKEGERISQGMLLGTLNARSAESSYQSALSLRNQAQDAYNRMKVLHERGSLPEIEWVETQSKLQQAVSSEEMAKKALEDTRLYAPASGIIVDKNVEIGQNVTPGMAICKIASTDGVKFKINVPEREINSISLGQQMAITVPGAGATLTGTVIEKGAEADAMTRSYPVWLSLSNPDGQFKPGMLGEAIVTATADGVPSKMSVPVVALRLNSDNRPFVWVVSEGIAERRFVEIGNYTDNGVELLSGLHPGEIVVTGGIQKIGNGTEVTYGN